MEQTNYINEVAEIITKFNDRYYNQVTPECTDFDIAIKGLWLITSANIQVIKAAIGSDGQVYAIASSVRLILECLSDALYLSKNQHEAKEYWRNQEKIKVDLMNRDDKWSAFIEGTVNQYGHLREKGTLNRIKLYMDKDILGDYNFLCFYTHPNIAALQWINVVGEEELTQLILQSLAHYLNLWLDILPHTTSSKIDKKRVAITLIQSAERHIYNNDSNILFR